MSTITNERDFKWIRIPKEIWLNNELTMQEKLFIVEINSLDNDEWCYASNSYFSEFFWLSKWRCSQIINLLEGKGYISVEIEREGKMITKRVLRILNRVVNFLNTPSKFPKHPYLENDEDNNTYINNTYINNNKGLEEKKDSNITKTQKQQSIENANNIVCEIDKVLLDFYTMRKQIKKPMTQRAKELLLMKLEKLAKDDDDKKIAILNQSILNSRMDVYEIKGAYVNPQWDVPLDISEKDKKMFEEIWKLYPHTYQSNKDECLEIFSKSWHKESYIDGVRLILMQVAYGIKELQYIPAFKKFLITQQPLTEDTMGVQCAEIRIANMKQTEQQRFQSKKIDDIVTLDFVKKVRAIAKKYQKALWIN